VSAMFWLQLTNERDDAMDGIKERQLINDMPIVLTYTSDYETMETSQNEVNDMHEAREQLLAFTQ